MTEQRPGPLVPADVDLRDFAFMPLDVARLRDSELASNETPEACWAAVLLWAASWHQLPAASVPNDDKWLAKHAGYVSRGKIAKEWVEVRTGALRGFVECSDSRLYHPVVAEKAIDAWKAKLRQRLGTECARIKKHNQRHGTSIPYPEFDAWFAAGCPCGQPLPVPGDSDKQSPGQLPSVPRETASNRQRQRQGQGEGQGQGQEEKKSPRVREKAPLRPLAEWIEATKAKGEKPIPDDDPVLAYAEGIRLPREFLALAWREFRIRYTEPKAKRYVDWRAVFRRAVRENWLKLWYVANDEYQLTTVGIQAQRAHAEQRQDAA